MSDGTKKTPAIVKFIGNADDYDKRVTQGKEYYAYFIEFWETERCNLHIKDDSDKIGYWYDIKDFEIITDVDEVLNFKEATVRCIKESIIDGLKSGKEYIAIGIGGAAMSGMYLVLDESGHNYFYPPDMFEIVEDTYGILSSENGLIIYDFENTFYD